MVGTSNKSDPEMAIDDHQDRLRKQEIPIPMIFQWGPIRHALFW